MGQSMISERKQSPDYKESAYERKVRLRKVGEFGSLAFAALQSGLESADLAQMAMWNAAQRKGVNEARPSTVQRPQRPGFALFDHVLDSVKDTLFLR